MNPDKFLIESYFKLARIEWWKTKQTNKKLEDLRAVQAPSVERTATQ